MPSSNFVEEDPYNDPSAPDPVEQAPAPEADRDKIARSALERRHMAYVHVFAAGAPSAEDRQIVLDDLKRFCRADTTPWHENERLHCVMTGRHEVHTRIRDFIDLSTDALVEKYDTQRR